MDDNKKGMEKKPHDQANTLDAPENKWKIWGENTYIPWKERFDAGGSNPDDPPPNPPGTGG